MKPLKRKICHRASEAEQDEEEQYLGSKKKLFFQNKDNSNEPVQAFPIYPLVKTKSDKLYIFTAVLLGKALDPSKIAVIEAKSEIQKKEIEILRKMGCYGYSPESERNSEPNRSPKILFLFDAEIFFLHHKLGVLRVAIPKTIIRSSEEKTPTNHLWDILVTPANRNSAQPLAPFPARYAAYVYYRSRGWIVRPSLNLGGIDYLLYSESPDLRHAAYAVVVILVSATCSIPDFTAHLRVASSAAKKLIVARVSLPEKNQVEAEPWNQIEYCSIEEIIITRSSDII